MKRRVSRLAVLFGIALLFLFLIFPGHLLVAPIILRITLLIGWWPSMVRLIRAWHPGAGGIALFVFAVVLLVAGSHSFLRWLYASLRNGNDSRWPANWRWKWTVCGLAMLACALLAICSLVLTTHQIYWISKSSDPLFAAPFRKRNEVRGEAISLQMDADKLQWDSAKTRESFLKNDFMSSWTARRGNDPAGLDRKGRPFAPGHHIDSAAAALPRIGMGGSPPTRNEL